MPDIPVPEPLRDSTDSWLATDSASRVVATARLASTVMLTRESADGPEVFMLRRVPSMAFAPSMWVFPGGGVDPRDEDADVPWAGPSLQRWSELTGLPAKIARATVVAAVREVFEECGVLLAGPTADTVVSERVTRDWQSDREALIAHRLSFGQFLLAHQLVIRTDLLALQDHWVTPEMEPKRYDTWFFAARLPDGQHADGETTEADVAQWVRPANLLADASSGAARTLPPTRVQLERIARWADAQPATTNRAGLHAVMPRPVATPDGTALRVDLND